MRARTRQRGGLFNGIIHKATGSKDKYGRKRKLNPKYGWRRPREPYYKPLTLNEKQNYYNEVKDKMNHTYMWKNVNKALGGLSPKQRFQNNLKKKLGNTFLYKNVNKNIKQKGGNKRRKKYKKQKGGFWGFGDHY